MPFPIYRIGLGQDSHRFMPENSSKPCIIGGVVVSGVPGMDADSDGDVVYHSLCNAITSLSGVSILGEVAPKLCKEQGIIDSSVYLQEALKTLGKQKIVHIAFCMEGKRPRLQKKVEEIRKQVAKLLQLDFQQIGITITSGDELTDFGKGLGLQCFCSLTTCELQ